MDDLKEYADRLKFEIVAADFLSTEAGKWSLTSSRKCWVIPMPDQFFINIALLAVGVSIGALLGETSRQQHDRALFREYINFMAESEQKNELLFREVIHFQTQKGASHEEEQE